MSTPSAELDVAWHLDDGAATLSNFAISSSLIAVAQVFGAPDWATIAPGETVIAYAITGMAVRVGRLSTGTSNCRVSTRRVDATGKPTGPDLQINVFTPATIASSTTQPPWSATITLAAGTTFGLNESAAVVFTNNSGTTAVYVGQETGGTNQSPSGQQRANATDGGSAWTLSATIDLLVEVKGIYYTVPGLVPPTLDSATTNTIAAGAGTTSHSFAVTIGSNSDRCLWVGVEEGPNTVFTTPDVCSGATYGGVDGMKIIDTGLAMNGQYVQWYRWVNPPVGTYNVVLYYPGANHRGADVAISYYNINQTQPEGRTFVYLDTRAPAYQTVAVLGDTNLVGLTWETTLAGASTAAPQGNTTMLGGAESAAASAEGAVAGYSIGDTITGWQLSANASFALGVIGILSTTGIHLQFAPPPPDYSDFPKALLRTAADPDTHSDPDNGP